MSHTRNRQFNPASAVLWAAAFVIAGMIIVQAGKLPQNAAHADTTAVRGDYTLLTTGSGRGENQMLYVIDGRDQILLVYEVEDGQRGQIFLRDGGSLANLMLNARR